MALTAYIKRFAGRTAQSFTLAGVVYTETNITLDGTSRVFTGADSTTEVIYDATNKRWMRVALSAPTTATAYQSTAATDPYDGVWTSTGSDTLPYSFTRAWHVLVNGTQTATIHICDLAMHAGASASVVIRYRIYDSALAAYLSEQVYTLAADDGYAELHDEDKSLILAAGDKLEVDLSYSGAWLAAGGFTA